MRNSVTILPDSIHAALRDMFHAEPTRAQSVSGGMVNQSARVEVGGTSYFVKWKHKAPPALFEAEARGLALLRAANAFRIPAVIAYGEATTHAPAYLILEWIDGAADADQRLYAERFGQALAALHRHTNAAFGLDHSNYIGELPQHNTPSTNWAAFYRDQRILVQMEIARHFGYLPPHREAMLNQVMERVNRIFDGITNPPALLHGDLWLGNFIVTAGSQPALVDPAVYYGDREVEIAFAELFTGDSAFFLDAYQEAYPLEPGYEYRRPLLQLYPMLVHLNHFGEAQYGSYVDAICKIYLE